MKMAALFGIVTVAWLLVLGDSYLFFGVIIPLGPAIHDVGSLTEYSLLKIGLTFALALLWFVVIISLTRLYVRARLAPQPPTAAA